MPNPTPPPPSTIIDGTTQDTARTALEAARLAPLDLGDLKGALDWAEDVDAHLGAILEQSRLAVAKIYDAAQSANTKVSYRSHLRQYHRWLSAYSGVAYQDFQPIKARVLEVFLTQWFGDMPAKMAETLGLVDANGRLRLPRATTVIAWCAAIRRAHVAGGYDDPFANPRITLLLEAKRRGLRHDGPPKKRARPLLLDDLMQMVAVCRQEQSLEGLRDAALLLTAFASGGRRRSELAGMRLEHTRALTHESKTAYLITILKRKRGDAQNPDVVPVLHEAARALQQYLLAAGLVPGDLGPLFRKIVKNRASALRGISGGNIWQIVKRRAAQTWPALADANRDSSQAGFSPHSIRHGFLSECGLRNIDLGDAVRLSKHEDLDSARAYQQIGEYFSNPAAQLTKRVEHLSAASANSSQMPPVTATNERELSGHHCQTG